MEDSFTGRMGMELYPQAVVSKSHKSHGSHLMKVFIAETLTGKHFNICILSIVPYDHVVRELLASCHQGKCLWFVVTKNGSLYTWSGLCASPKSPGLESLCCFVSEFRFINGKSAFT